MFLSHRSCLHGVLAALGVALVGTFAANGAIAEESQDLVVELSRKATFTGVSGDPVDLAAGTYGLLAIPGGLRVTSKHAEPIDLRGELDPHELALAAPMAVSVDADPQGLSPDIHRLAVFLPNGLTHFAEGAYSGLITRAASSPVTEPTQIELPYVVRFDDPDDPEDDELLVRPGIYSLERRADDLVLVTAGGDAYPLASERDVLSEVPDMPIALSLRGDESEDADLHFLVLLLPDGTRLRAAGEVELIVERGVFDDVGKAVKKTAKKTTKKVKNKVDKTTKKVSKTVESGTKTATKVAKRMREDPVGGLDDSAKDLGKLGYQTGKTVGKTAVNEAKQVALEAKRVAEMLAQLGCMAAIEGLNATIKVQSKASEALLSRIQKQISTPQGAKQVEELIETILGKYGDAIVKGAEAASKLGAPSSARRIKPLLESDSICKGKKGEAVKIVEAVAGKEIDAALRSASSLGNRIVPRGAFKEEGAWTVAVVGNGGSGVAAEAAFRIAAGDGSAHTFIDLAGGFKAGSSAGGGGALAILPWTKPSKTGGPYMSLSVAGGPSVAKKQSDLSVGLSMGLELLFETPEIDITTWRFLGFQYDFLSVGRGWKPVEGNLLWGYGIGPL